MATASHASATHARRDHISALLAAGGVEACRDAVLDEIEAEGVGWCLEHARAVLAAGDVRTAGALADVIARVRWGSARRPARRSNGRALPPPDSPPRRPVTAAKLRHDADQFALLRRRGLVGGEFDTVIGDYRTLADGLSAAGGRSHRRLSSEASARIGRVFNRVVHVAETPRQARALGGWNGAEVEQRVLDGAPAVVVDDVLTPDAGAALLRFCQESTVWSGSGHADGRLQASFFDGFSCPLLVQVAEELQGRLPRLTGPRRLVPPWAVKDAGPDSGATVVHSHPAVLSVVVWITPTAANLDPDRGGVLVDGDPPTTVPYRGNRAVLLAPGVGHTTDVVRFDPAYEGRRIALVFQFAV